MKSRLPWRAHNPSGWAQACAEADLGPLEEWSLLRLLDRQWERGWLPASVIDVAALLRADGLSAALAKEVRVAPLLAHFFPTCSGDKTRRQNPELAAERDRAKERQEALSKRGQRAAEGRYGDKDRGEKGGDGELEVAS